jgi:leader peptidase (prepilin peptidase) / N-methyltransferase
MDSTASISVIVLFVLLGGLGGAVARRLLARVRRGAAIPPGPCEAALAVLYGVTGGGVIGGTLPTDRLPLLLGLGWLAVAAGALDLVRLRLPDALTGPAVPGAVLALLPSGPAAVGRGLAGGAVAVAVYGAAHLLAPAALGAGDVKLAGSVGTALTGVCWPALGLAAVGAALLTVALAVGIAVAPTGTRGARPPPGHGPDRRRRAVPHGPPMLAAAWLVLAAPIVTGR